MKYILLIILLILAIFICYKIIALYPFPSKYLDSKDLKWHFFTKDRKILKEFTKYYFFIKSIHLSGDFKEIKAVEIQTFLPFYLFKFYEIKGFLLKKSGYGISYFKNSIQKEEEKNFSTPFFENGKEGGFGWIKTNPQINFKIKKNGYFKFESILEGGFFPVKNGNFKIKNFDIEIYKASSPYFSLLFPEIEEIEVCYEDENGFFKIKEKGKEKILKFGEVYNFETKEENLSFYLKVKETKYLKKFIKNPFLENLKEIEIKCFEENDKEKCKGYFLIKLRETYNE